jgi:hypothetical protein
VVERARIRRPNNEVAKGSTAAPSQAAKGMSPEGGIVLVSQRWCQAGNSTEEPGRRRSCGTLAAAHGVETTQESERDEEQ